MEDTRRSPVDSVDSLSHDLQGFIYIPGVCLGFLNHQKYNFPSTKELAWKGGQAKVQLLGPNVTTFTYPSSPSLRPLVNDGSRKEKVDERRHFGYLQPFVFEGVVQWSWVSLILHQAFH